DQSALALSPTARPHGILPLLDLLFGASRLHGGGEFLDVEIRISRLVLLLDQQPVFFGTGAHQRIASAQPDAVETALHLAPFERLGRRALLELKCAPVPDHHGSDALPA